MQLKWISFLNTTHVQEANDEARQMSDKNKSIND